MFCRDINSKTKQVQIETFFLFTATDFDKKYRLKIDISIVTFQVTQFFFANLDKSSEEFEKNR